MTFKPDVDPSGLAPLPTVEGGFKTILADPPWRFTNRTGKVAPEHRRLGRYSTLDVDTIAAMGVGAIAATNAHLYLWVPNALLPEGLKVMEAWGFRYVSNIVWAKRRKDGGPDGRGVGFYFRNVTELLLFGVKGSMRTLPPARSQVNMIETRKREHSRKPDEQYDLIERCSPGPYLELFARYPQEGWVVWGDEASEEVEPRGRSYRGYTGGDLDPVPHRGMNESAVTKKLAEDLLDATYTASGWETPEYRDYNSPLTRKAVAAVLRELADQGLAKKPSLVLDMADYLHPDEGEAAA